MKNVERVSRHPFHLGLKQQSVSRFCAMFRYSLATKIKTRCASSGSCGNMQVTCVQRRKAATVLTVTVVKADFPFQTEYTKTC